MGKFKVIEMIQDIKLEIEIQIEIMKVIKLMTSH